MKILHLVKNIDGKFIRKFRNFIETNPVLRININHIFFPNYHIKDDFNFIRYVLQLYNEMSKADLIIIHGFFYAKWEIFLHLFSKFLKKSIWIVWGGDLYDIFIKTGFSMFFTKYLKFNPFMLKKFNKTMNRIEYFHKSLIIKKIDRIASLISQDYFIVKKLYKTHAKYYSTFYPNPVGNKDLDNNNINENQKENVILLGNSATYSNQHFEILDLLSILKKKKEIDFKIMCPLSYGNKNYAKEVIKYANKELKEEFIPLLDFMNAKEYATILNSVNVAIMNHRRQQALGTIISLLYAGKKVYISNKISSYFWFKGLGLTLFNVEDIKNDFINQTFFYMDNKLTKKNHRIIKDYFSDENCIKKWKSIFLKE